MQIRIRTLRCSSLLKQLLLPVCAAFVLAACGSTNERDETVGWSPQRIYEEAKDNASSGSYEKAIKLYERLEARYPYGPYAQQAQLEIAYAYYKSNEPASAIAACERFIKLHPNHPNVDYAYYLRGLANFNDKPGLIGSLIDPETAARDPKAAQDAFDAFSELVTRFPNSRYAEDARERMSYLVNALANNEVLAARYYLQRRAPLAAVNRAQYVINHYPNAPANAEALQIMIQGYDQLGLNELRDDTKRVFEKNYAKGVPKTELNAPKPWWQVW